MTLAVQQPHRFRLLGCNCCQLHEQVHVNKSLLCNALCISRWDPQRLQVECAPHRVDSMGSLCLVSMHLIGRCMGLEETFTNSQTGKHPNKNQTSTITKTTYSTRWDTASCQVEFAGYVFRRAFMKWSTHLTKLVVKLPFVQDPVGKSFPIRNRFALNRTA